MDTGTSIAIAPATTLITNPNAIEKISKNNISFNLQEQNVIKRKYAHTAIKKIRLIINEMENAITTQTIEE